MTTWHERPAQRVGDVEILVVGSDRPLLSRAGRLARARLVLVVLLVVAVLLCLLAVDRTGDRLPPHATIGGVAVGGLDRAAAEQKLRRELGPVVDRSIQAKLDVAILQVPPSQAGLTLDYASSVRAQAKGGRYDPRQIWWVLRGGSSSPPVIRVDERRLRAYVSGLALDSAQTPHNARVGYVGQLGVGTWDAVDGVSLDQPAARAALQAAFLGSRRFTVTLPVHRTPAAVDGAAASRAMSRYAFAAVADDIVVQVIGGGRLRLTPAVIRDSLTFVPRGSELVPQLDGDRLLSGARGQGKDQVNGRDLVVAVLPALTRTGKGRTVAVPRSSRPTR